MNSTFLMERAKEIANSQGRLASSPAEITKDGKLHLCSASCIAQAAIELADDHTYLNEFFEVVATSDKSQLLPGVFIKYGLDGNSAKRILAENDKLPEAQRLDWFNSLSKPDVD